jgi:hypothetical protein
MGAARNGHGEQGDEPLLFPWSGTSGANGEAALKRQGGSRFLLKIDTDALREAMLIKPSPPTARTS